MKGWRGRFASGTKGSDEEFGREAILVVRADVRRRAPPLVILSLRRTSEEAVKVLVVAGALWAS